MQYSRFASSAIPSPFKPVKGDSIDEAIRSRTLADHPEHLPQILQELALTKFYKALLDGDVGPYYVQPELLVNRALNFYEAANCGAFDATDTRVGFVASMILGCIGRGTGYDSSSRSNHSTAIPVTVVNASLANEVLPGFKPESIVRVNAYVRHFNRTRPTPASMSRDRVAVYMLDAFLMWPLSKRQALIDLMIGKDEQTPWLPKNSHYCKDIITAALSDTWSRPTNTQYGVAKSVSLDHSRACKRVIALL